MLRRKLLLFHSLYKLSSSSPAHHHYPPLPTSTFVHLLHAFPPTSLPVAQSSPHPSHPFCVIAMPLSTSPPPSSHRSPNDGSPRQRSPDARAPDVVEFLEALKNYEKEGVPVGAGTEASQVFELDRMRRLLSRLGDPLSQYPVVHVAGTKGKGSTVAFISSILRAAGYCVGSYTSPHIWSIQERITAGKLGEPISSIALQKLFEDVWSTLEDAIAAEHGSLTNFEVLTALAFKHFAREKVDIAVIEVGLGGSRDATNVIESSGLAVAVITNIGEEHLDALGGSLESIAFAKSGIIKHGRPVVLGGPLDSSVETILRHVAALKEARIIQAFGCGVQYSVKSLQVDGDRAVQCCDARVNLKFDDEPRNSTTWKVEKNGLQLQVLGCHQMDNAMIAVCAILCLRNQGWKIQDSAIWAGLSSTIVPGRFQFLTSSEVSKIGCEGSIIVVDGAHTAGSAKVLADTLRMAFPKEPLALIVAMASEKDHAAFAGQLLLGAMPKVIVATEVLIAGSHARSASASALLSLWIEAAKKYNLEVVNAHDLNFQGQLENTFSTGFSSYNSQSNLGEKVKVAEDGSGVLKGVNLLSENTIFVADANCMKSAVLEVRRLLCCLNQKKGVICVTGSLHVISAVLSLSQA